MINLSTEQEIALIRETETSIFLIQEGLLALNRLSGANDFYHGPMEFLAQGFERLMKVIICLGQLEHQETLPTAKQMRKNYRHDLVKLTDAVVDLADRTGYTRSRPAAKLDRNFIAGDPRLRSLLSALTAFGAQDRYYNLDILLDPGASQRSRQDPSELLDAIEREVLDSHPEMNAKLGGPEFSNFYKVLKAELIETLQRFARGLCRLFTLGPLGDRGSRLQPTIGLFLFLRDEDLDAVPARWYETHKTETELS